MDPAQLKAIERWNLVLSGVGILVAAFFLDEAVAVGISVGAVIACVNFSAIRRIWLAVIHSEGPRRNTLQMLMVLKMILLMVLVVLAIKFLPLSPAGLAVGLSVFLISIAIESVRFALRGSDGGTGTPQNGHGHSNG